MRSLLPIAAVLLLCAGCGTDTTTQPPALTAPAEQTAPAASEFAAAESAAGIPPKPDAATADAYVRDLVAIDPEIVGKKPDRAVSRGRDQCGSVAQGYPEDKLVELVQRRFTAPGHSEGFGPEKSRKILAVVRKYLCP
ncbi:hypothetical protein [Actinokineospora globicatena]|uniref:DUF732 domain-containing protein n=1 Tax=Actinokineospora globicatena TaxID=103729 RepID=A0A9W6QRP7_9PSEU|nr:hypothetical protein [Actinokineospora globicatena]GLW93568.1 hypothetical protein Aglo03_43840 [Actinokineospora globicatena]